MQLNEYDKEDKVSQVETVDMIYVSPLYKTTLQYITMKEEEGLEIMNNLNTIEKEQQIIEDLLSILIGYDGDIIFIEDKKDFRSSYEQVQFDLNIDLPQAQLEIVYRILPAAKAFHTIQNYCELFSRYHFGLINHSSVYAIQSLIKEYHILICQLENQFRNHNLNLQKFWFYFHPRMKFLFLIKEFIMFVFNNDVNIWQNLFEMEIPNNVKGAYILDALVYHTTRFEGDEEANQLYKYLFCHSSLPYLKILLNWIYKGAINDNYDEFFIKENKVKNNNLEIYWNSKFSIDKNKVPNFLLKFIDHIFIAGKLINVIKQCNYLFDPLVPLLDLDKVKQDNELDIQSYIKDIERAYLHSNQEFVKLISSDQSLIKQLRCFKRYFFLEQSDFFTHFLDLASEDLLKPARLVSTTKIQSLFDLSLSNPASVTYLDPFKDKLKIMFTQFKVSDIINQLDFNNNIQEDKEFNSDYQLLNEEYDLPLPMIGIESFTIQCKVEFPLCLIFSNKDQLKYQIMFRNLMLLKHVEQLLESTFIESIKIKRNMTHKINELKNYHLQIHTLQNRMLNLIQNLIYYICIQVIEPNFNMLEIKLKKCTTLQEIIKLHSNFLNKCFEQSTLINDKLYGIINKILRSSLRFIHFIKKTNLIDQQNKNNTDPQQFDTNKYLNHFEYFFLYHVKMLINGLNHFSNNNDMFLSLALIIDFNGFYSNLNLQEKPPSISSESIPNSPLFTVDGFF